MGKNGLPHPGHGWHTANTAVQLTDLHIQTHAQA